MKISDITNLFESFKDAKAKFTQEEDLQVVEQYLDSFRSLVKKGIVKGKDKDIGTWIKKGWHEFEEFVDAISSTESKSQVKKSKKSDSILVHDDDQKTVVVPLTRDASFFYGKGTKWCTTSTGYKNRFADYFYGQGVTFFYVLMKNGDKYAAEIQYNDFTESFENKFYDDSDKKIEDQKFHNETGISLETIFGWLNRHKDTIEKHRRLIDVSPEKVKELLLADPAILPNIDMPSDDILVDVVKEHGLFLIHNGLLRNPSETIKKAIACTFPEGINVLKNTGHDLSDEIKKAAIKEHPHAIKYIDDQTNELQQIAISVNYKSASHIKEPTQDAQDTLIQMKKVSALGYMIDDFSDESIVKISEWYWPIVDDREVPEQAQLNAIRQSEDALSVITNPTDKAKQLHDKIWNT